MRFESEGETVSDRQLALGKALGPGAGPDRDQPVVAGRHSSYSQNNRAFPIRPTEPTAAGSILILACRRCSRNRSAVCVCVPF